MYDGLTAFYRFSCPSTGECVRVRLSAFRLVERLPGAAHPAVYDVVFSCPCGQQHEALVAHDELDWAPIAPVDTPFYNVMTGRLEQATDELAEHAVSQLRRGRWPWCFYCYSEERARPLFPSAFRLVQPGAAAVLLAASCPGCGHVSANLVSAEHLDVPFYSDPTVGVIAQAFPGEVGLAELAETLGSGCEPALLRRLAA